MLATRPPSATLAPLLVTESDAGLARRAGRGDDRAFEILVGRHRDALSRYCRSVVRHDQDAEDAFQATMIRAYRGLRRVDGELMVRAWLFRIAHNECLRVLGTRPANEALSGTEEAIDPRPPERAQTREDLRQLQSDLLSLPHQQRAALVLRELSGLSHQQIAHTLGSEPEAVKQLIHEARVSLGEFDSGRSLACDDVRRRISDGDGRVLRARTLGAHLRGCAGCREFRAGIARRPRQLAALFPALPLALVERICAGIVGGGTVSGVGGAGLLGIGPGVGVKLAGAWATAVLLASSASLLPGATGAAGAGAGPAGANPPAAAATAAGVGAAGAGASSSATGAGRGVPATVARGTAGRAVRAQGAGARADTPAGASDPAGSEPLPEASPPPTGDQPASSAPVSAAAASLGASLGGVGVSLPGVGASAQAGVSASLGSGVAASAAATVAAPVVGSVEASATVTADPDGGVSAGISLAPGLGVPPVVITLPPLFGP